MSEHVRLEGTSLCAGVIALFASKRLFYAVNQHVTFQIRSIDTGEAAVVATFLFLPTMLNHVCFQVFGCFEGEITLDAEEGFVFALNFHGIFSELLVLLHLGIRDN